MIGRFAKTSTWLGQAPSLAGLVLLAALSLTGCTSGSNGESPRRVELPPPTPTIPARDTGDRAEALTRLDATAPGVSALVKALESGSYGDVLPLLLFEDVPCTPPSHKSGPGPWCDEAGLPDGATLPLFPEQISVRRYFTAEALEGSLAPILAVGPVLELVARHRDGWFYVSFALPATPDSPDGESYTSVGFRVEESGEAPVAWFERRFPTYNAIDVVRQPQMAQQPDAAFEVWYVSEDLAAAEETKHGVFTGE